MYYKCLMCQAAVSTQQDDVMKNALHISTLKRIELNNVSDGVSAMMYTCSHVGSYTRRSHNAQRIYWFTPIVLIHCYLRFTQRFLPHEMHTWRQRARKLVGTSLPSAQQCSPRLTNKFVISQFPPAWRRKLKINERNSNGERFWQNDLFRKCQHNWRLKILSRAL